MRTGRTTRAVKHALTVASTGTLVRKPTNFHYKLAEVLSFLSFGIFDKESYLNKKAVWKTWNVFYVVPYHRNTFDVRGIIENIKRELPSEFKWTQRGAIMTTSSGGTLRLIGMSRLQQTLCGMKNPYVIFDHYALETGIPEELQYVYRESRNLPTTTIL